MSERGRCAWVGEHMGRPRKKKGTAAATATLEHFFAPATAEQLQQEQKQQTQKKQERETPREPPAKKARRQAQATRTGKGYVKLCDRVSEDGLPMLRKSAKSVIIYTLIKKSAVSSHPFTFSARFTTPFSTTNQSTRDCRTARPRRRRCVCLRTVGPPRRAAAVAAAHSRHSAPPRRVAHTRTRTPDGRLCRRDATGHGDTRRAQRGRHVPSPW